MNFTMNETCNTQDSSYFISYEDLNVHRLMLEDRVRNQAYKQAIFDNQDRIKEKIVLDVGAGTGILSVFCAQAGASKVYAVEASEVYRVAKDVVKENGYENVIEVLHSKVEEITLPEQVDIIVSEWMGFYLFHEGMLDSVITARDKFLKPRGLIFPEISTLYSSPCSIPSMFHTWDSVDGVSMKTFGQKLRCEAAQKPITELIGLDQVLAEPEVVCYIDLREVTHEDLSSFKLRHLAVVNKAGKYQGICLWFACTFPAYSTEPVTLSTEPGEPDTHWKQTVVVLPNEYEVEEGAPIAYDICFSRCTSSERRYEIQVTMLDAEEIEHPEYCNCYMTKCILVKAMLEKYEKGDAEN